MRNFCEIVTTKIMVSAEKDKKKVKKKAIDSFLFKAINVV